MKIILEKDTDLKAPGNQDKQTPGRPGRRGKQHKGHYIQYGRGSGHAWRENHGIQNNLFRYDCIRPVYRGVDMAEMTLGSLFDGIAGFPLAASRQGIKTVWVSEIEPDCIDIAKRHFPEALQLGDITQIDGAKIPVVDIISFGSPCQDLSVAGKQTGLDGSRSGLFMEAVRITREMREKTNGQYPKYIIWENVAGAFSSNKGEDFRRVLEEITQSNISMPKSGKWATAGMVGNEGPGGGRSVYRMAIA